MTYLSSPMTKAASVRATAATVARLVVAVEFVLAVAAIAYAGYHDLPDVFVGAPRAVPVRIAASCGGAAASESCAASVMELNAGRFRVATADSRGELTVTLTPRAPDRARQLLVRVSQPKRVELTIAPQSAAAHRPVPLADDTGRVVTPIEASSETVVHFAAKPDAAAPIVVEEIGLFESGAGLLADARPIFRNIPPLRYHGTLVLRAVAALALFTIAAAVFLPAPPLRRVSPVVLAVVAFSMCVLDLAALYSPYTGQDLRSFYASGPLQERVGANLNGGLWQGMRLLHGQGLTLMDGVVPWERMPGYGLFCALAGALFGHATPVDIAISTVLLQALFYSAAVGVFAWAAASVMPAAAAWGVGLLVAWLPKQVGLTQVDAIIAPVALLVLASLCLRLGVSARGREIPIALDVFVHATFALWFAVRPDVLPGWLAVSLWLHWRERRRLLIPVTFFLAIGCVWGAYKARYTGEFALTTTSAGASLFCGLFEVPSRFALTCSDPSYFAWIHEHTPFQPQSAAANSYATREVIRFWLTYPGHLAVMLDHKLMQMLDGDLWPGYPTQLQVFVFGAVRRYWLVQALLAVLAVTVVLGHRRERSLLLAWPLWFDAPLFWIMFASLGRFYSAVGVALLASAVPPLFERSFYDAVAARPWRAATVLVCAALFATTAWSFHDWLLRRDAFHYWTPLLDPSRSALSGFK